MGIKCSVVSRFPAGSRRCSGIQGGVYGAAYQCKRPAELRARIVSGNYTSRPQQWCPECNPCLCAECRTRLGLWSTERSIAGALEALRTIMDRAHGDGDTDRVNACAESFERVRLAVDALVTDRALLRLCDADASAKGGAA